MTSACKRVRGEHMTVPETPCSGELVVILGLPFPSLSGSLAPLQLTHSPRRVLGHGGGVVCGHSMCIFSLLCAYKSPLHLNHPKEFWESGWGLAGGDVCWRVEHRPRTVQPHGRSLPCLCFFPRSSAGLWDSLCLACASRILAAELPPTDTGPEKQVCDLSVGLVWVH